MHLVKTKEAGVLFLRYIIYNSTALCSRLLQSTKVIMSMDTDKITI